jgi:hypothetical protein
MIYDSDSFSEAFSALRRDVFEEIWNTDMSAIEAELEPR